MCLIRKKAIKRHTSRYLFVLCAGLGGIVLSFHLIVNVACAQERKAQEEDNQQWNILNLYDAVIGLVDAQGTIMNRYGTRLGTVDSDGIIYNVSNIVIGKVDENGQVFNQSGTRLGSVDTEGNIYTISGRKTGEVRGADDIILVGGAARIVVFKSKRGKGLQPTDNVTPVPPQPPAPVTR